MTENRKELREKLKSLSNRYAVHILKVLSPETGEIIPSIGWEDIVEGILKSIGHATPSREHNGEKTQQQAEYEELRNKLASGGTLYESMNRLVGVGFVQAVGAKGRKQRRFRITHEGRLALEAMETLQGVAVRKSEIGNSARVLLKHKNFIKLLPAQNKFLREVGSIDSNLIVQMPPGSGKTFLAMTIILDRLMNNVRCLYLTPYTSLSRQIMEEYAELFENLDKKVVRHDGLTRTKKEDLADVDLVVGIYESVLSSFLRNEPWTRDIELVVVDELTELESLNRERTAQSIGTDRSARLDSLMAMLKPRTQIMTLSSRFGSTEEACKWLDADIFRPSFRLTPDEYIVQRKDGAVEIFSKDGTQRGVFDTKSRVDAIHKHLKDYHRKSILFVVGNRGYAEHLAGLLTEYHPRSIAKEAVDRVTESSENLPSTERLKRTLEYGIAFHHSGLSSTTREKLETEIRHRTIRCVVATTGITAGTSFPFDSVIIAIDQGMFFNLTRSRYLQIAGRIGEYHLVNHGGAVYLMYGGPTKQFETIEEMIEILLHKPLESLQPGPADSFLLADIVAREMMVQAIFDRKGIEEQVEDLLGRTLRAHLHPEYRESIRKDVESMIEWLISKKMLLKEGRVFSISPDMKAAIESGLALIDYSRINDLIANLEREPFEDKLIEILLEFRLVQAARPRTIIPSEIELRLEEVPPPEKWYEDLTHFRKEIKKHVIEVWLNENDITSVIYAADMKAKEFYIDGRQMYSSDLDEGDLISLLEYCSDLAFCVGEYLAKIQRKELAHRFEVLGVQLMYGVREDIGRTDLMELQIPNENGTRSLTRTEARILYEQGYKSIEQIVKRNIDASKEGLARDRFAVNSGLEEKHAKIIYRAALECIRSRLKE